MIKAPAKQAATVANVKFAYVIDEEFGYNPDQSRADDGTFGEGAGIRGGLPKNDGHISHLPKPATGNGEDPHNQVRWAGEKAREAQRPVFLAPNKRTGPGQGPHALAYKAPTSGDYHAVHPDGKITFHQGAAPKPKKGKVASTVGFARSCEAFSVGEAPHAVRLWRAGWNVTDKGSVNFTPRSAELVMSEYERRGNPLVFDYEHESLLELAKRGGAPMRGVASAPTAAPEIRADGNGQPELWARDIGWTAEAKRQIASGERRQISPVCDFDLETGEVLNLKNVALCREGATHSGTLLASVAKGTSQMDELIKAISDAANAGDLEKVKELCAGAGAMAKPPEGAPPAQHMPPPVAMAASRGYGTGAFAAELAQSRLETAAALKEAKIGRVEGLIAASRDCFDAADEREHLDAADPVATRRHIESVKRKVTAGTIAASRTVESRNPPKGGPVADEMHGLTLTEIEAAVKMGVTIPNYVAAKARNEGKAS